jgi:hydroxyacylglutathione hydrolase
MGLEIVLVPLLKDNYAYLAHDEATGITACVDPAVAEPLLAAASSRGWVISQIINTHHHHDHTGGNAALAAATGARVTAPEAERDRIAHADAGISDGETYKIGETAFVAIATPGHTSGPISYYSAASGALFSGDTLFALGCGRLFEGTAAEMWASLKRLRALPDETLLYCGHEYTEANCRFALSVEPGNEALTLRAAEIASLRAAGTPTIPSTIGLERRTNPFLRADDPALQRQIGLGGADPAAVFAEIRRLKDVF